MKKKLILISIIWARPKDTCIPLGHMSLMARMRQCDNVKIINLSYDVTDSQLSIKNIVYEIQQKICKDQHCDVYIGFGAYIWNETIIRLILKKLREVGYTGKIILGGPQVSYAPPGLELIYPECDFFIRGFAEDALYALMQNSSNFKGIHEKNKKDCCEQSAVEIGRLPSPWLTEVIPISENTFIRMETQRGCPFRCSYCQHNGSPSSIKNPYLPLERISDEISLFTEKGVKDIVILDPVFNMGKNAISILELFKKKKYNGKLSLQCRFETLTSDFVKSCNGLDVTLEFGIQTTNQLENEAINRKFNIDNVTKAIQSLTLNKIDFEVSIIYGLPHQTVSSFMQTIQYCLNRQVPRVKAYPLLLLRGTALEKNRNTWALIENEDLIPKVVQSNSFTKTEWQKMEQLARTLRLTENKHPKSVSTLEQIASHSSEGKKEDVLK